MRSDFPFNFAKRCILLILTQLGNEKMGVTELVLKFCNRYCCYENLTYERDDRNLFTIWLCDSIVLSVRLKRYT